MSRIVLFKEFYWSTVDLQCLLISAVQQSDSVKVALVVKNLPANAGDLRDMSSIPEAPQEDPLEKGTGTHSSILAWRIPWTEEPGGL